MTLKLANVSRVVDGTPHISDVTISLEPGSINVLLGPTLSGKTSLMRLMAGLDLPTSGRIEIGGRDVTGLPVQKRSVAMVYQQFINYPNLTVYDNIASPLQIAKLPKAEIDKKVNSVAKLLRLEGMLARTPLELSGGQQQRTAIARALVKEADLVLLDEPLANLDYKLREELREELPQIFSAAGAIFVYATTEPTEALLLGGNTAALHEGRVSQFGPTVNVYRMPNFLVTAQIFSDPPLNLLSVEKRSTVFHFQSGEKFADASTFSGLSDGAYCIGFRPNHLYLHQPNAEAVAVSGAVAITEITGSESFVHVDAAGERWVALAHGIHNFAIGETVSVFLDPARFFVFDAAGALVSAPAFAAAA